jgi:hypothetical protein
MKAVRPTPGFVHQRLCETPAAPYAPEINSNVIGLPIVQTPTGMSCVSVPDSGADLTAWTNSFKNIQCYDTLKVNAIVNEIKGKNHQGTAKTKVPTIFGMNFQAVSVGQKLVESSISTSGGYLDAAGTPTESLLSEIKFVDASIAEFVKTLKAQGLYATEAPPLPAGLLSFFDERDLPVPRRRRLSPGYQS